LKKGRREKEERRVEKLRSNNFIRIEFLAKLGILVFSLSEKDNLIFEKYFQLSFFFYKDENIYDKKLLTYNL